MDQWHHYAQVVVRRGTTLGDSLQPGTAIVVATRNDALQSIVDATPPDSRPGKMTDLHFPNDSYPVPLRIQ